MKYDIALPFGYEPRVSKKGASMWIERTPFTDAPVINIQISEWKDTYGTLEYAIDVKKGHLFAIKEDDWIRLEEKGRICTKEPLEPNHFTPIQKESPSLRLQTLDSKEKVPIAESTRKDIKNTESEPRSKPPTETIPTPVRRLSFERMSEDEEINEAIKKEKDEVEQVQWELEKERMRLAIEKANLENRKFRIAEDRLRALRQQRKVLEDSIMKMSQEIAQDVDMTTADRKQRRINMENEYLNQIDYEEGAVQEYLPTLLRAEEVLPDVMTTDSQISSTVDPIEFMDEKALWNLKLKHMRADQCKTRTHKMYKLLIESAKDPQRREELEQMLIATINSLDKKMGKFKAHLDDYDQKEYVLAKSEQVQKEQEKALKEGQGLKEALEGLQDEQRNTQEELSALQKEKEEADKKQAALREKINEERRKKIQKEQQLEQERQKLKALEKRKREQEELKLEKDKDKKIREERDREMARKIAEQERRDSEKRDQEIAKKLQEKQKLEKEEQDRKLAEQLEKERKEEEEMMKKKRQEEHIRIEEAKQREELYRIEREHQKLLEKERKAKEKRKISKKPSKPTREEQKKEKENLMDTIETLINGKKPKKPKDLGWDYQKDKEAEKVFERKKELKRQREEEKARKYRDCPECRFPKHPGEECPCKICGKRGHKMEDCPKLKSPPKKPLEEDFCIECKKIHPLGRCMCKLCKTEGHLAAECP